MSEPEQCDSMGDNNADLHDIGRVGTDWQLSRVMRCDWNIETNFDVQILLSNSWYCSLYERSLRARLLSLVKCEPIKQFAIGNYKFNTHVFRITLSNKQCIYFFLCWKLNLKECRHNKETPIKARDWNIFTTFWKCG